MSNYRDNRAELANNVQDLRHELGHVQAENMAMRQAILQRSTPQLYGKQLYENPYVRQNLQPGHRVALSHHSLKEFPVWMVVLLHFMTFGLFSIIHFGGMHGSLPKASDDDPSSGRGVGFFFIPYYNFYWMFFANLRLYDRLQLQYELRGQQIPMSRGFVMAAAIVGVIPYINILVGFPIMWLILGIQFQKAINGLAKMPPLGPQLAPPQQFGGQYAPGYASPYAAPGYGTPPATAPHHPGQPYALPQAGPPMAPVHQYGAQPQVAPLHGAQPHVAQPQAGSWGYPSPHDASGGPPDPSGG